MNLISKPEAIEILRPFGNVIDSCITEGWYKYKSMLLPEFRLEFRTRANLVRDLIVSEAKSQFYNLPGCQIYENNGLFLVNIDQRLNIRFKKIGENFSTSNYQTNQAIFFNEQGEFFPDYVTINLNAGYIVDRNWSKIFGHYISCPIGRNTNNWVIDIRQDLLGGIITEMVPELPIQPDDTDERLVTVKTIKREVVINGEQG